MVIARDRGEESTLTSPLTLLFNGYKSSFIQDE
jgi:hypothetical protein